MTTPGGKVVLGGSRELDPNVTPFSFYNRGVKKSLQLASWVTGANDFLQNALLGGDDE